MKGRVLPVVSALLLLTACGQAQAKLSSGQRSGAPTPLASTPSATISGSRIPSATAFALLEARHCAAPEPAACESISSASHDTVVVAGLDGYALARATFTPRQLPVIADAATVVDLEAQVADGGVYFIDGSGVVRRLDPSGTITIVATFAIDSSFQSVSFAVRPDGKQLMAAVLTYPKHQPSSDSNQPFGTFTGPWALQIESANAGGRSTMLHQWQAASNQAPNTPTSFPDIWLAGWDATGPIALVGQEPGTQNAWLSNQRYFNGRLARLNPDGTPGTSIGPANCLPYWRPIAGLYACTPTPAAGSTTVDVVDLSGKVLWSGPAPPGQYQVAGDFAISPSMQKLAMDGEVVDLRTSAVVQLASNFQPEGWLDPNTLIGLLPLNGPGAAHVGILHLSDPSHPNDWGFSGAFVGALS